LDDCEGPLKALERVYSEVGVVKFNDVDVKLALFVRVLVPGELKGLSLEVQGEPQGSASGEEALKPRALLVMLRRYSKVQRNGREAPRFSRVG